MQRTTDVSPRTFGNDQQLPRVPLPGLDESCARFLEWCAPLLTAAELAATEAAVAEFLAPDSPAHDLQAALGEYDKSPGVQSWLDEFWRDRYLGRRDRIALNANFFFLFQDSGQGQVERAATLVAAALDYKSLIDEERLPPATQRGTPLSMEQNRYLFSATRIPGELRDTARTPYSEAWPGPSTERHIVVFHRGHMLALDVIGENGQRHTVAELEDALRGLLAAVTTTAEPGTSIGQLTTKARAEWAASRAAVLAADPGNAAALDVVERALLCLCLEHEQPADPRAAADGLLHGNSANRWFDKAVSLIVYPDGTAGYNGEHCQLDGTTVIGLVDAITTANPAAAEPAPTGVPGFAPVEFVLDDAMRADVLAAGEAFAAYAAATASALVSVPGFSSERAKQLGSSPDAFAQVAFQLTHHLAQKGTAQGHLGATYESVATRQFRNGRTEAMRVVTPEMVAFVAAMNDHGADADTRRQAFRAAAAAHVTRAKGCQAGLAPEQHLWELQLRQRRTGGGALMALFESPGWRIMRDDYLSTSAVPSPQVRFWGFGSTSEKCIGVAYAMLPDRFDAYLSTPAPVRAQMETFARELPIAVAQLEALLGGS